MELLAHCINLVQLYKELDKLPSTLEKAYEHLLDRINSLPQANRDLAYRVFGWVAFAEHPLKVEELQHAFAIEPRTKELNRANTTDEDILLSICAGLVIIVVIDHQRYFKFVHDTQEYFTSQQDKLFPRIHVDFTCICLAHMSFNDNPLKYPFSWYSLFYWDFHARKCSGSTTVNEILAFLDDKPTQMENITQPFQEPYAHYTFDAAFFTDVLHAVKLLLADPGVNLQHLCGVCLAAYVGNDMMVRLLTSRESDAVHREGQVPFLREVPGTSLSPAQKDSSVSMGSRAPFCTPLIAAASNGHQKSIEALLRSRKLNSLNAMSSSGLTALSSAILCNSIPVVRHLLCEHDIDMSIQFKGQTPIMLAAGYGFDEIVKLFLERKDDDPNAPGENGRTALHAAIEGSQHGSIDLLLKSGHVDVNRKDSKGRTALSIAAGLGDVQSVKMLVDHMGIDMLVKDNDGKSAYEIAVEERQDEIVTLLAEHGAKDLGDE
ncbi:ankyrin repeat-containing domain protein [Armillaria luteobubalina]|uniref:Ankyrin repeat-containing domain protein n=1 Tax=Armillaria luteobubalina TaxID=153913 RepID=A0AA39PA56_9AGAR|nr:ankyrin repeat-containing domain protein [Armillaria luteobubalina]